MFDPDIHIPAIARGAAIPHDMQLEVKRQEQEKRRYRITLVQAWLALGVSIASLIVAIIALMR